MNKKILEKRTALLQDGDMHLIFGPITDARQASASARIDAPADRKWLAEHPKAEYRIRPASSRELAASGMPIGSQVHVFRGLYGSQTRAIAYPKPLQILPTSK